VLERRRVRIRRVVSLVRFRLTRKSGSFTRRLLVGKEMSGGDTPTPQRCFTSDSILEEKFSLQGEKLNVMLTPSELD